VTRPEEGLKPSRGSLRTGRLAAWRVCVWDPAAWALFALALLVYLPGIQWGLPGGTARQNQPWGADELGPVGAINELYGVFAAHHPTFNPQYPLFHYFCEVFFVAPYYALLWVTGHISHPDPNFPYGLDNPSRQLAVLTLLARLPSLLMAAGVVAIAYKTGQTLGNRLAGALAALFVLVEYPMFYYSRTSNVDMGELFWSALGLYFFASSLRRELTFREAMAFGGCAALATASKDASYAVFLPAGIVFAVRHARAVRRAGGSWYESLVVPAAALAVAIVVYLPTSGLILRPSRYFRHVHFVIHGAGTPGIFYNRYPPTLAGYASVASELTTELADAMGVPLLVFAAAGAIVWAWRDRTLLAWLLPALGVVVGVILPVRFTLLRFVLAITYVLALCAAEAAARGFRAAQRTHRIAVQVACVTVVVWGGLRGLDFTRQMLHDSRYDAAAWLRGHTYAGERVGHLAPVKNMPPLPAGVRTLSLDGDRISMLTSTSGPELFISMPLLDIETVHERGLPDSLFDGLLSGATPYRQAALIQSPSWFSRHPVTFVNPPVRIFVRHDVRTHVETAGNASPSMTTAVVTGW
jgi:dolichyl-phosphate-mannose-protein mannosyltransferase